MKRDYGADVGGGRGGHFDNLRKKRSYLPYFLSDLDKYGSIGQLLVWRVSRVRRGGFRRRKRGASLWETVKDRDMTLKSRFHVLPMAFPTVGLPINPKISTR